MSGHSKWSTIKHKKAAADAKRGQAFTRIIREIVVAAREGGGDAESNSRLRQAIVAARIANMPQDNIKRAVQRGTGELPGLTFEEVNYEGYGPEGVALYVETMTDNPKRTTPEIRHLFTKYGGNLGAPNSVAWMFERKGQYLVNGNKAVEDRLMEVALEAGADDIVESGEYFEVTTPVEAFEDVGHALEAAGIETESAEIARVPSTTVAVGGKKAESLMKLLEALEEQDDVQKVWGNMEFDEAATPQS